VQVNGTNASDFALSGLPAMPVTVQPHASFVFNVTMTASATGLRTATIDVLSDDPDAPTFSVALTGAGGSASASPSPAATRSVPPTHAPSPTPQGVVRAVPSNDSLALGMVFGGVLAAFAGLLYVRRMMVARDGDDE
jgi:hypothetical protein